MAYDKKIDEKEKNTSSQTPQRKDVSLKQAEAISPSQYTKKMWNTNTGGSGVSTPQVNPNQQYIDQMNDIYSQIMSRGPFSYDLESDPLYQQYADQYMTLGKQAMRDTQAQSAALTGGYGNSWANSAGSQAYQGYLNQLNSMVPEFYDRAYNAWLNEGDLLAMQYNMAATHPGAVASLTPQVSSGGGRVYSKPNSNYNEILFKYLQGLKNSANNTSGREYPSLLDVPELTSHTAGYLLQLEKMKQGANSK